MDRPPGGPWMGVTLGGIAGQRMTLHRKNSIFVSFRPFGIRLAKKNFEKSLDLANFVNFADLPQGVGVTTHTSLLANPNNFIVLTFKRIAMLSLQERNSSLQCLCDFNLVALFIASDRIVVNMDEIIILG